jgi:thymidylate synthase
MSSLNGFNYLDYLLPTYFDARDLPDAWYQCNYRLVGDDNSGIHSYIIDKGSFENEIRREFNMVSILFRYPGTRPLVPDINLSSGIPAPTSMDYVEEYLPYLMTDKRKENETYTYGERLVNPKVLVNGKECEFSISPINEVIKIYKAGKYGTNQATMEVGMPQDIIIEDPPCLRLIDTRMLRGRLHFIVYFRSWDLWTGFPSNLAALQLLKEYMCQEIGVEDGSIIAVSKGLHLYGYHLSLALKLRGYSEDVISQKLEIFRKESQPGN